MVRKMSWRPTKTQRYSLMLRQCGSGHRTIRRQPTGSPVSVWTGSKGLRKPSRRSASHTFPLKGWGLGGLSGGVLVGSRNEDNPARPVTPPSKTCLDELAWTRRA